MSSNLAFCTAFKQSLFSNITSHTFKIALYTSDATLNASTTAYTATGEVSGAGYSAGGFTLSGAAVWTDGGVVGLTFSNFTSSTPVTISDVAAALIYDTSSANVAVCVLPFATPYEITNDTITIQMPTANAQTGLMGIY